MRRMLKFRGRMGITDRIGLGLTLVLMGLGIATAMVRADETPARIISLGGSVTEIIYALGEEERRVARDTTAMYPDAALDLPDVGYIRALSPEGVLSAEPDLILSEEGAGPPEVLDILRVASIPFVEIPEAYSVDGIVSKILAVGEALGVTERAEALAAQVQDDLQTTINEVSSSEDARQRVLFILSTQGGRILASGTGTSADAVIGLAGADNAITTFEGYKPVTAEAIAAAKPQVILMMDRGGDHSVSNEDLFEMPALSTTPAAENGSVVRMNGLLLLGFGPRTGQAVRRLHAALYPAG